MEITTRLLAVCLIAAGLSGCGGNSDYTPTAGMSAEQIFAEACAKCHGEGGEGKLGFLLSIAGTEEPSEEVVNKIRQGGTIMPAFIQISESDAQALADYLKNR